MASTQQPDSTSFAGRMLLAMPGIGDERFAHAAVLLCSHDQEGALGINLGDSVQGVGLRELLTSLDMDGSQVADVPVLRGGPVEPQRGFVLHSCDWGEGDFLAVGNDWRLSGSMDVLRAIAAGNGPQRYLIALGFTGWSGGQLEQEMAEHAWYLGQGLDDMIFKASAATRWSMAFASYGIDTRMLATGGGTA